MKSLWFAGLGEVQAYSQTRWEKEGIKTSFSATTYIIDTLPDLKDLAEVENFPRKKLPMSAEYYPELDE